MPPLAAPPNLLKIPPDAPSSPARAPPANVAAPYCPNPAPIGAIQFPDFIAPGNSPAAAERPEIKGAAPIVAPLNPPVAILHHSPLPSFPKTPPAFKPPTAAPANPAPIGPPSKNPRPVATGAINPDAFFCPLIFFAKEYGSGSLIGFGVKTYPS